MAIKKFKVELWFNSSKTSSPSWKRIKYSTDNTITFNAETEERDYIGFENATTVLKRYKPSLSQPVEMRKGEADYQFVFDKAFNLQTGTDAEADLLIVFAAHSNTGDKIAWKTRALFTVDSISPGDETITCTVNLNGTIDKGTVTYDNEGIPSFSPNLPAGVTGVTEPTPESNVGNDDLAGNAGDEENEGGENEDAGN